MWGGGGGRGGPGRQGEGEGRETGGEGGGGVGGEVGEEALGDPDIHALGGEEEGGGLVSAAGVARLELLQVLQGGAREQPPALEGEVSLIVINGVTNKLKFKTNKQEMFCHLSHFVQVPDCQLEDVCLLQLGNILSLCLKSNS